MAYPRKYFISNLINNTLPFEEFEVWLQGTIEQALENYIILSDGSGKAKITNCDSVNVIIDRNCLRQGSYCCVLGKVVKMETLPEIKADKIVDLSSKPHMKSSWDIEVQEANLFLEGKLIPSIK